MPLKGTGYSASDTDWRCPVCFKSGKVRWHRAFTNRCSTCKSLPASRPSRKFLREEYAEHSLNLHFQKHDRSEL